MSASQRVQVPVLSELVPDGFKTGSNVLVEFDPVSEWFALAVTIAAKMIQRGGNVAFNTMARAPEQIEDDLSTQGIDAMGVHTEGRLEINDWYSATLSGGQIEPLAPGAGVVASYELGSKFLSVKAQDLSVEWLKDAKRPRELSRIFASRWLTGTLVLVDSFSSILRFNEEKPFAELLETRIFNRSREMGRTAFLGLVSSLHSDWFYKRIESAMDGVIDIRVIETEGRAGNSMRVRGLRGTPHDSAWHRIEIKSNGEAALAS